jgi:serine/threonine protein kinase
MPADGHCWPGEIAVSLHSDKPSRRERTGSSVHSARQIILDADPAQQTDSHASTVELQGMELIAQTRGSSLVVTPEEKTVISKRPPADETPPPIHIGPLESRKSLEGETLDHFQLESYVGGGGMGAVYRAHDMRLNRRVAVKILSRDQSDSETVRRFRNEAQSAARLDDPHIARVYYIGEDKGWNFIVFEFIEGTNLRELVEQRGPLPLEESLDYTLQVCEALGHAADRDVVHRDIKPSNVLVTADGEVKLVDMGLARLHQVESGADDLTQSGVTLGTFDYISPEQARDPRLADVRSDIYSLGCTLYFMLAGRAPFPDGTALQKLIRHNSDEPPDVRLFRPDIPDELVAILSRMLAKKPEHRFQSPVEIMQAINRVAQRLHLDLGASSSARIPVKWSQPVVEPASWWHRLMPVAIAALVLIVLAALPERWPGKEDLAPALPAQIVKVTPAPNSGQTLPQTDQVSTERIYDDETSPAAPPTKSAVSPAAPDKGNTAPAAAVTSEKTSDDVSPMDMVPSIDLPSTDMVTSPVSVVKKRVIVGALKAEDAVVVPTFAAACQYASQHPDVVEIELAFDGRKTVPASLEIASRRLTIKAAPDCKPELLLQPSPDEERHLVRMTMPGGQISWQGVRIRFDVPSSSREWALFQYAPESMLDFRLCVLTIVNTSPAMIRYSPEVSFFEPGPVATTTSLPMLPSATPQLDIRNCVLRGDATVIRLRDAALRFQLLDSFVTTSEHFLESGGSTEKPRSTDLITLNLEQSTVAATGGFLLCGTRFDRPYRFPVRVDQHSCVIVADSAAPVVEFREPGFSSQPQFTFSGSNNCYPKSNIFFRHVSRQDEALPEDYGFGSLPGWAVELKTFDGTLASPAPEKSSHEQLPSDYVLKSPADANTGSNPAKLPSVEGTIRRPIMGATNMGTMKPDPLMPMISDDTPATRSPH